MSPDAIALEALLEASRLQRAALIHPALTISEGSAMTMNEARAALAVPAAVANCNTVQDGQYRLREALALADRHPAAGDTAPDYVRRAVAGLNSWVEHALDRRAP